MRTEFCVCCGGRLAVVMVGDRERPVCSTCGQIVYANPAPVAMVLARDADRRLLLVRRGVEPLKGFWALPSGYVETDESVEAAAVREVLEETGLDVVVEGLEGVYSKAGLGVALVVYQARIVGGVLAPGSDADDVRLADPRDVPAIRVPAGGTELDRWFAGLLDQLVSRARDPYAAAASRPPPAPVTRLDERRVGAL